MTEILGYNVSHKIYADKIIVRYSFMHWTDKLKKWSSEQ